MEGATAGRRFLPRNPVARRPRDRASDRRRHAARCRAVRCTEGVRQRRRRRGALLRIPPRPLARPSAAGRPRRRAERRQIPGGRARRVRLARLRHRRDDDDADGARCRVPQSAAPVSRAGCAVARAGRASRSPGRHLPVRVDRPGHRLRYMAEDGAGRRARRGHAGTRARSAHRRSHRQRPGAKGVAGSLRGPRRRRRRGAHVRRCAVASRRTEAGAPQPPRLVRSLRGSA